MLRHLSSDDSDKLNVGLISERFVWMIRPNRAAYFVIEDQE